MYVCMYVHVRVATRQKWAHIPDGRLLVDGHVLLFCFLNFSLSHLLRACIHVYVYAYAYVCVCAYVYVYVYVHECVAIRQKYTHTPNGRLIVDGPLFFFSELLSWSSTFEEIALLMAATVSLRKFQHKKLCGIDM